MLLLAWLDAFRREFRYALRLLRKSPTFTLAAVSTLALCIGANTAVFSVVDTMLLRPLPYPEPDRLASVAALRRGRGAEYEQISQNGRTCELVRQNAESIEAAVFAGSSGVNFVSSNGARYVQQQRVSAGFFDVLGVRPLIGREFTMAEDRAGGPALAILSYGLWQQAFQADASILGRTIALRGEPYTVIGVMPRGFHTDSPADVWTPLRPSSTGEGSGTNYELIARLRPGVSWVQAETELAELSPGIVDEWHMGPGQTARLHLVPLKYGLTEDIRKPLLTLWAAAGLVLLIGCVNIAGLLLARSDMRWREIATRMALGSGRWAIVRQLLAESLVLALAGGAAGIVLGRFALEGLKVLASSVLRAPQTGIHLDGRVVAFTAAATIVTSLLFGLYPAWQTARTDLRTAMARGGSRGGTGHQSWARRMLIVTEVALSVVLLVCAGLLIRTLTHLMGLNPGFDSSDVITASLSLQDARYNTSAQVTKLFDESLERIRRIPGVDSAGIGLTLPYQRALNDGFARLDGPHASGRQDITNVTYVTPGYFEALRMTPLRGRIFRASDRAGRQPVVIVNEAFARKYLRGQEAVGSHLRTVGEDREIVGVIGDVQQSAGWGGFGPSGAVPCLYLPAAQTGGGYLQMIHTWFSPSWVVRSAASPRAIMAELQSAVASVDPQLPFAGFRTMDQVRRGAFSFQRLNATLAGILAGLALLLAAVGIYGLIASSVGERTRELGIRMALGATVVQAIRAVSAGGVRLALIGLLLGCAAALAAARVLRTLIWGVASDDPLTFASVCGVLLLVAGLASLLPALRIAGIHPAQTLREE